MIERSDSPVVLMVSRALARLIQLFGAYVVFHGHYSPGGGFQGGALMAAGFILLRITEGVPVSQKEFPGWAAMPLAAVGALVFAGTGILPMLTGGNYLDYGAFPVPGVGVEMVRYYGILIVEIGIALAVTTTLVSIYDTLMEGGKDD